MDGTFDLDDFEHQAPWLPAHRQIQMRLVSKRDHDVTVDGQSIQFNEGEWIHTENSNKFTPATLDGEAACAGLELVRAWTDDREWLRVSLYRVA